MEIEKTKPTIVIISVLKVDSTIMDFFINKTAHRLLAFSDKHSRCFNTEKTMLFVARMPNGFDFSNVSFIICMSMWAEYKVVYVHR